MSDSRTAVTYLKRQREIEDREERKIETTKRKVLFVAFTLQAIIVTLGILLIFWESFREWGTLPPASGVGLGLYGGVGLGIALLWIPVLYSWYQLKQPL